MSFPEKCSYYGHKCQQHLFRTNLAKDLALDHISFAGANLSAYHDLIASSIDTESQDVQQVLQLAIIKTHFLVLKVEFEFFLSQLLLCIWTWNFEYLAGRGKNKLLSEKFPLKDFAKAVADDRAKDYVLANVVPRHGLKKLADAFQESTDIKIAAVLNKINATYWSQIFSAFEVRHLVEHVNGRTDDDFMSRVYPGPLWRNSSWRDVQLAIASEIPIRNDDYLATFNAMIAGVPLISDAIKGFSS